MASRTRKSPALPLQQDVTAAVSYIRGLPGAVFFDDAMYESIEYAAHLERIRREYEKDDCQEMLWHDLSGWASIQRKSASLSPTLPRSPIAATEYR
jgi:hypothetical protein